VSDTGQRSGYTSTGSPGYEASDRSGWTAWVLFAGVIMVMIGAFHVINGLVALFEDEYYVVRPSGLVLSVDYTAWGWTHLLAGLLLCAAGWGAMVGQTWARVVGVVLAMLSALVNMLFIAAYPLWSIIIITLDVVVIYALIVHGRELKD
jgi:hypothetical protein